MGYTESYSLNNGISVFYGNNAQGKTNFIESMYLLGHYKSFRSKKNIDLIKKIKRQVLTAMVMAKM